MKKKVVHCPDWLALLIEKAGGEISFYKFMDLALNDPLNGAYASGKLRIGRKGDFVTSSSMGPLFSELLAKQIVEWVEELFSIYQSEELISIIDIGPGEGDFVYHLIHALQANFPTILPKVKFILIEINEAMLIKQRAKFKKIKGINISWSSLERLAKSPVTGIIIANELLDALPVDRIVFENNKFNLQGVKLVKGDQKNLLEFVNLPLNSESKEFLSFLHNSLSIKMPPNKYLQGWTTEIHTSLNDWFKNTYACLEQGKLLIIDYAYEASSYYSELRSDGTIMSYSDQKASNDILANAGLCDLTAHLCLESMNSIARNNGWDLEGETKQGLALLSLGLAEKLSNLKASHEASLSSILFNREVLLRLVDPSALGGFRWCLFTKPFVNSNADYSKSRFLSSPKD